MWITYNDLTCTKLIIIFNKPNLFMIVKFKENTPQHLIPQQKIAHVPIFKEQKNPLKYNLNSLTKLKSSLTFLQDKIMMRQRILISYKESSKFPKRKMQKNLARMRKILNSIEILMEVDIAECH